MRSAFYIAIAMSLLVASSAATDLHAPVRPLRLVKGDKIWVDRTLRKMTVEEKVGQLFMIWVRAEFLNAKSPEYEELSSQIKRYHIGSFALSVPVDGPFLVKAQPFEAALLLNRLQRQSKLPLLIAADFESGVSSRVTGATPFPSAMAFGAAGNLEYAESFGKITAQEARAIGVHWNFFPDADVNSNPANPIINTRSFGEDPQQVGDMVAAYIRGAHSGGMLVTAKHFPGHGDTATDSHLGVAQVSGNEQRLDSIELPPFRRAIEAGVDAVMVAHVTVPALESDPNKVATTSPAIVTQLLKQKLGFHGMVVTDAMDMAGLTRLYADNIGRASVDAFKAGNDVLLIPPNLDASYHAVVDAVKSGEISKERLDFSVRKILQAKADLDLQRARLVDIHAIDELVGAPANSALGQHISDDAITLVRDNGHALGLKAQATSPSALPYQAEPQIHNRTVLVIVTDDVRLESGRILEREFRARIPDSRIIYVDPTIASALAPDVLKATNEAETVVLAIYAAPVPGSRTSTNEITSADPIGHLIYQLLDQAQHKTTVIAVGNPYFAKDFPQIENYLCTFSNASISEVGAAKAIFGEIAIHGHLPVTIPNIARRGAGIERPAQNK